MYVQETKDRGDVVRDRRGWGFEEMGGEKRVSKRPTRALFDLSIPESSLSPAIIQVVEPKHAESGTIDRRCLALFA